DRAGPARPRGWRTRLEARPVRLLLLRERVPALLLPPPARLHPSSAWPWPPLPTSSPFRLSFPAGSNARSFRALNLCTREGPKHPRAQSRRVISAFFGPHAVAVAFRVRRRARDR